MEIQVLILHADGTQTLETRTVPDNYFDTPGISPEAAQTDK
jgi:hypothetical protein